MGEIITGIDFKSKDKSNKHVSEGPFDFAAMEREIATALWAADFGGPILVVEPFFDPKEPA